MKIQFNLTRFPDDKAVVTAFIDGEVYSLTNEHAVFDRVVDKLRAGDGSVVDDFDVAAFAQKEFHKVTDRVNIRNGVVYLDDSVMDDAVGKVIVDYLTEGNDDAMPLVRFMERLEENPSHRSRNQFWNFVRNHGIHIDDEGYVIMYKGVNPTDEDGVYKSVSSGEAFVNGEKQVGQIHTRAGDVVSMPRREISDDPNVACHAGLHCGARTYASSFASVLITVRVDPADVVSVPTDCNEQKVRVSKYEIMDVLTDDVNTVRWHDEVPDDIPEEPSRPAYESDDNEDFIDDGGDIKMGDDVERVGPHISRGYDWQDNECSVGDFGIVLEDLGDEVKVRWDRTDTNSGGNSIIVKSSLRRVLPD